VSELSANFLSLIVAFALCAGALSISLWLQGLHARREEKARRETRPCDPVHRGPHR
jgi:hypothetical protein